MKLSALITKLLALRKQHGDLLVVGRGYDECGYDDIRVDPEVFHVQPSGLVTYQYDESTSPGIPVICIDPNLEIKEPTPPIILGME